MKTYKGWKSGDLDNFIYAGDEVDQEMVNYCTDVVPPITYHSHLVQMGEPFSHINGRATYITFYKEDGRWYYAGHCHAGEHVPPTPMD